MMFIGLIVQHLVADLPPIYRPGELQESNKVAAYCDEGNAIRIWLPATVQMRSGVSGAFGRPMNYSRWTDVT